MIFFYLIFLGIILDDTDNEFISFFVLMLILENKILLSAGHDSYEAGKELVDEREVHLNIHRLPLSGLGFVPQDPTFSRGVSLYIDTFSKLPP